MQNVYQYTEFEKDDFPTVCFKEQMSKDVYRLDRDGKHLLYLSSFESEYFVWVVKTCMGMQILVKGLHP